MLITIVRSGLGELICLKFAAEGCNVAINYNTSEERAREVRAKVIGTWKELGRPRDQGQGGECVVLQGVSFVFLFDCFLVVFGGGREGE